MRINGSCKVRFCIASLVFCLSFSASAKTRWSSLQHIPHADLMPSGRILVDAHVFWAMDSSSFSNPVSVQRVTLGISEWINFDIGYAGGLNMGFKARVLQESPRFIPSLSVGVQNFFTNREAYYFQTSGDSLISEMYLALAKSMEPLKLRVHLGVMSAPISKNDLFNPFFGLERYFGGGLYMTLEGQRRTNRFSMSLFTSWRTIRDRVEFNIGIVDLEQAFKGTIKSGFVKPGLRGGIRVNLGAGLNTMDGLYGIEDRIDRQNELISNLKHAFDTLKNVVYWHSELLAAQSGFPKEYMEQRTFVVDELAKLRNFFDQEPFDPQLVKSAVELIVGQKEIFAPHLRVLITDSKIQQPLRVLAVSMLGEFGDRNVSDILLGLLGRSDDPQIIIESMIALGKLKEIRAGYMIRDMVDHSDDAVAFTATEVLRKLQRETGTDFSDSPSPAAEEPVKSVLERRIGE